MKNTKQILIALFGIFFTVSALAMGVTKDNATQVATNYFSEVLISNGMNHTAVISESFEIKKDGNTLLYIFNFEKGGYVIVSADERFTPILGYSPNGYYDKDNMPDGFEFLIKEFSEMVAFIQVNNIEAKPEYLAKWKYHGNEKFLPDRNITIAPVVTPMTALWNQDFPYNFYCPPVAGASGGKAYAGAVATAMSLIMYYWRWPWQGIGYHQYKPSDCNGVQMPTLNANFGETFYDFNGMYGTPMMTADKFLYEPIALLLYHAGIAVETQYCGTESGSQSQSDMVVPAMKDYFKYDKSIQQIKRQDYTNTSAWAGKMKEQLDLRQPIYVSGQSQSWVHAFICDGYDTNDMFHYNFGWSGSANGYFVADKPGEFTSQVAAVINFIPDRSQGYPSNCNGNWTITYLKGILADCSGPLDNYSKGVTATWLIDPVAVGNVVEYIKVGCNEIDLASGDFLRIYDGENDNAPLLGEFTGSIPFETVTSTNSRVLVKFTTSSGSSTAKGFLITYEAKPTEYCFSDITYTAYNGTFTDGSPEDMNYANNSQCKWYIAPAETIGPDTEITLNFTRLDTEEGVDLIKIYDYAHNIVNPIATISGHYDPNNPPKISIKTTEVMITFTSNSYVNGKGFEIQYSTSPVGIKESESINNILVYPNPTTGELKIMSENWKVEYVQIFDIYGRELLSHTVPMSPETTVDILHLSAGIYFVRISTEAGEVIKKVLKE